VALIVKDRIKETTTSTGTGAVILAGAATGFQAFSVIGNGNTTFYTISHDTAGSWEVGVGTYTLSTNSLSRDTVLSSSNSGSLVPFGAGTKDVFVTYPAALANPIVQNNTIIAQNVTLFNNFNGFSVGPVTVLSGYSVTVPSGQTWLII